MADASESLTPRVIPSPIFTTTTTSYYHEVLVIFSGSRSIFAPLVSHARGTEPFCLMSIAASTQFYYAKNHIILDSVKNGINYRYFPAELLESEFLWMKDFIDKLAVVKNLCGQLIPPAPAFSQYIMSLHPYLSKISNYSWQNIGCVASENRLDLVLICPTQV